MAESPASTELSLELPGGVTRSAGGPGSLRGAPHVTQKAADASTPWPLLQVFN
jgi:hypothetical protein